MNICLKGLHRVIYIGKENVYVHLCKYMLEEGIYKCLCECLDILYIYICA